jgi:hypothetical protein
MYDRLPGGELCRDAVCEAELGRAVEISILDFAGYSQLFARMHFQRLTLRLAQTELTKP